MITSREFFEQEIYFKRVDGKRKRREEIQDNTLIPEGKNCGLNLCYVVNASSVPREKKSVFVQTEPLTEPFIYAGGRVLLNGDRYLAKLKLELNTREFS